MMGLLWTLTSIWAFLGSFFVMAAASDRGSHEGFFAWLFGLAIVYGPIGLLTWFVIWRAGERERQHRQAMEAAGVPVGQGFDHAEKDSGIGINVSAKTLTLRNEGFWKTYAFADVREWETVSQKGGQAFGVGVQGSLQAMGATAASARAAEAASGLFLQVKDVDNAKWRVAMKDPMAQARWMELLRQQINES